MRGGMDGGLYFTEIWGFFASSPVWEEGGTAGTISIKSEGLFANLSATSPIWVVRRAIRRLRISANVARSGSKNCPPFRSFKDQCVAQQFWQHHLCKPYIVSGDWKQYWSKFLPSYHSATFEYRSTQNLHDVRVIAPSIKTKEKRGTNRIDQTNIESTK